MALFVDHALKHRSSFVKVASGIIIILMIKWFHISKRGEVEVAVTAIHVMYLQDQYHNLVVSRILDEKMRSSGCCCTLEISAQ